MSIESFLERIAVARVSLTPPPLGPSFWGCPPSAIQKPRDGYGRYRCLRDIR
jgi:hypothetical protein